MADSSAALRSSDARFEEPDQEDDEIDLREYVRTLWAYRAVICIGAVVLAVSVVTVSLLRRPTYHAESTIILSQLKLGERPGTAAAASFRPVLESQTTATSVIQEFGLDKAPYRIFATDFFTGWVTIEEVRNTPVFRLSALLYDPKLAADVVNSVARHAVETSRRISQQEAARSRDDLRLQRDEAKTRMDETVEKLRKFREESQLELLRKDVDAMLAERGGLLSLLIQIETQKARLDKAEQELSSRQRVETVKRSIDSDAAMMESARGTAGQVSDLLRLETRNEFVNPVYQSLDSEVATARTTLASLERKKTQVVEVRKLDAAQSTQLTRLYRLEADLAALETERDLAVAVYRQVDTAYEVARVQVASGSAQLEILETAIPPDRPKSRNLARNTLIALILGLTLVSAGVLIYNAASTVPRNAPRPGRA